MKDGKVRVDTGINHSKNLMFIELQDSERGIIALVDEVLMEKLIHDMGKTLEIYRMKRVYT